MKSGPLVIGNLAILCLMVLASLSGCIEEKTIKENQDESDGLIGYWKLDEMSWNGEPFEVIDSSKYKNDGTAKNGVTTVKGINGNCGDFDNINDYILIGNPPILNPSALSICIWFKPESNKESLITKGESRGHSFERDWDLYGNGTHLRFMISDGMETIGVAEGPYPELEMWHFAVATWDGTTNTDSIKLYCDGDILAKSQASSIDIGKGQDIYIGGGESPIWQFGGLLDDVRIYDRALDHEEIQTLYKGGI